MELARKLEPESSRMFELAELLRGEKSHKDALKELLSITNEDIKQHEEELATLMIEAEMPRFTKNGVTFYLTTDLRCSAAPGRQEELYEVLRAEGAGDLIKETVNGNSLKSWVKEKMEAQEGELPSNLEGLVNIYERSIAGTRKGSR